MTTAISSLYEVDRRGKLYFNFHPGQLQAWDSEARFTFVFAGTQGGKTSFLPWWLWREIQNTARPGELNDYIAATSSYDLFKLKLLPSIREVFEHVLQIGRYWSGDRIMELCDPQTGQFLAQRADDPMYARIILRSAASGGGLESLTAKAAILDECGQDEFSLETWEAVLRRLSLSEGRVLGGTTIYNLGWTKTEVYDRWIAGDKDFHCIQFKNIENPAFPRAEYERAKATMPLHRFLMFYHGEFARPAGLIYDSYIDEIGTGHLLEDFEIPASWPRYLGVDFGAVNTAKIWIAEDPDKDRFIIYRESLEGGLATRQHVAKALLDSRRENLIGAWGGAGSEEQQRMDWTTEGLTVQEPHIADVEGGIAKVYGLFRRKRLFVMRSCKGLRDELGTYKRKVDPQGVVLDEIENKRRYHRLDSLRYVAPVLGGGKVETVNDFWE